MTNRIKKPKVLWALLAVVAALVALLLVPILTKAPEPGPNVNVPSMVNVPGANQKLTVEVESESTAKPDVPK